MPFSLAQHWARIGKHYWVRQGIAGMNYEAGLCKHGNQSMWFTTEQEGPIGVAGLNYKDLWKVNKITNSMVREPEGSSPHSQQPATGPCPETVESNPHPPSQSP
jgi:hypothetical protein